MTPQDRIKTLLSSLVLGIFLFKEPILAMNEKTVVLNYNGFTSSITTRASDVSELLIEELGGYENMLVDPSAESVLKSGDVISVQDREVAVLNSTVATNYKVASTPPPQPTPAPKPVEKPKPAVPKTAPAKPVDKPASKVYSGLATWYRNGNGLTTASRDFPAGTKLRVVAVNSGKTVDVVVNDYGPQAVTGNSLDLNAVAFEKIAPLGAGKIQVKYFKI